jgi:hypothetical protein
MIWFACKQCGRRHGRPETSVGSVIFCDCGQSVLVPWESTVPEPPAAELPQPAPPLPPPIPAPAAPPPPPGPRYQPVPVGEERVPPLPPRPRFPRQAQLRRRDPSYCFNHEESASTHTCADCEESFCADCIVELRGQQLCGPCKNFRARLLQRPPRTSVLALLALILGLTTGPLAFCLMPFALRNHAPGLNILALLPQFVALVLGALSVRDTENSERVGGRSLAITGLLTAAVGVVLTVSLFLLAQRQVS